MFEMIMNFFKSGFPLLWIILVTMAVRSTWRDQEKNAFQKRLWIAIVGIPPLISALMWLVLQTHPPASPTVRLALSATIFLLPVISFGTWLFGGR